MGQPVDRLRDRPGAWVDLGLTLPIFLLYHLAVVFLGVQNATDVVTGALLTLSQGDRTKYLLATLSIAIIFVGGFALLGRGQAFRPQKFFQIAVEGVVYAVLMRLAAGMVVGSVVERLPQVLPEMGQAHIAATTASIASQGRFVGFIMSLGAGFYEELAFRVLLFGLGAKALVWMFAEERVELTGQQPGTRVSFRAIVIMLCWSLVCAAIFSGVHYVGSMRDDFAIGSFVFRAVLGLALTLIYTTRGFAAAVWTHTLYDVWVLVFH